MSSIAIWNDVECGGYAADLEAWEQLAATCSGPVLELGCGGGRVSLHLARAGHEIWAVDVQQGLVETVGARAAADALPVRADCADIRRLDLDREFELVIAPMQLIQMVGDEVERAPVLHRAAAHLAPGGRFAAAILEGLPDDLDGAPVPLPDVREIDGVVYSSLPVDVIAEDERLELRRVRQIVPPDGDLSESEHTDSLWLLEADTLEHEAAAAGLRPVERLAVPAADGYVGAVIVVLGRP
jgi:SAM-dependent methyltransferase